MGGFKDRTDETADFDYFSLDEDDEDYASGDIKTSDDAIEIQDEMGGKTMRTTASFLFRIRRKQIDDASLRALGFARNN